MEIRTFFVEDNPTIRRNMIDMLEDVTRVRLAGFADTESAAKAWLTAPQNHWDLAIVDIFLKEGHGIAVLQACQQRKLGQKVVVFSNYATPATRERCKALGADAVFDKSNEIDALLAFCNAMGQEPQRLRA